MPRFVDIDPVTFNISAAGVAESLDRMSAAERAGVKAALAALGTMGEGTTVQPARATWNTGFFQEALVRKGLEELGYNVKTFCIQDSPRRAHSIAAQGGINAAKNYPNDGDSIYRLFYDTIKGGDFRAREADVWRLAQVSNNIIDQCVAQGVPFARDYAGYLDNRSFGGAQVSRTFYARGQTGQQLLLGVYSALSRQVGAGTVKMFPRHEMLDLVVKDGRAVGVRLASGEELAADVVVSNADSAATYRWLLPPEARKRWTDRADALKKETESLNKGLPQAMVMDELPENRRRTTFILDVGLYDKPTGVRASANTRILRSPMSASVVR